MHAAPVFALVAVLALGTARAADLTSADRAGIEAAVAAALPGRVEPVGRPAAGCSCDEGGACARQLAVRVVDGATSRPLWLVEVDGDWRLSRHARWLLDSWTLDRDYRQRLAAAPPERKAGLRREYGERHVALLRAQPACTPAPR